MTQPANTQTLIVEYVRAQPPGDVVRQKTIIADIAKKHGIKEHTVQYHVQQCLNKKMLLRNTDNVGVHVPADKAVTLPEIQAAVQEHIATAPQRVFDAGPGLSPYERPITISESPSTIAWQGREHWESIRERVAAILTKADLKFIERVIEKQFPLTEQQLLAISQGREIKDRSNSTNGHSSNGHTSVQPVLVGR